MVKLIDTMIDEMRKLEDKSRLENGGGVDWPIP